MRPLTQLLPLIALLLLVAAPAQSGESTSTSMRHETHTPAIAGRVYSTALQKGWSITRLTADSVTWSSADVPAGEPHLQVEVSVWKMTPEFLARNKVDANTTLASLRDGVRDRQVALYKSVDVIDQRHLKIGGFEAARFALTPKVEGEAPAKRIPTFIQNIIVTPQLEIMRIGIAASGRDYAAQQVSMKALGAQAEDLLASMRIRELSKLSKLEREQLSEFVSTPWVRVSTRRDYWAEMGVSMLLPHKWTFEEVESTKSSRGRETGIYRVRATAPAPADEDEVTPYVSVIMQGLPVGPISRGTFIETVTPHVKAILPNAKRIENKEIQLDSLRRVAQIQTRYTTGTKTTIVRTYTGTDPYDRKIKIRTYTAGGLTNAAHIVLVADERNFDAAALNLDAVLKFLLVRIDSPSLRPF